VKPVARFKPREMLQRDEFTSLAFAGKLVLVEGWEIHEAVLLACDYYDIDDIERIEAKLEKFLGDGSFTVVQVPNKLKGQEIAQYIKDKFG